MEKIAQGAEAVLYKDKDKIVKHRLKKGYRIPEIDLPLRKSRTKREAKVIGKLQEMGVPGPELLMVDGMKIEIKNIPGKLLKDVLDGLKPSEQKATCVLVGKNLAKMHDAGIIHGDLTTSNMISWNKKVHFIDFGLSFFSQKLEDKAVDIHLFKQALKSRHFRIEDKAFNWFLEGYKANKKQQILERFKNVESRGRHKKK